MFERDLNRIINRLKHSTKLFQLHTIPNYDDYDCSKWKVLFVIEKSIGWQSSAGRKLYLLVTFSRCIVALVTFSLYSYYLLTQILISWKLPKKSTRIVNLSLTRFSLVLDDADHDDTLEDKDTLDKVSDREALEAVAER